MNNKGQFAIVGTLIMAFVAVIVGASLLSPAISSNVAGQTTTVGVANQSITGILANATFELKGMGLDPTITPIVINASNGTAPAIQLNSSGEFVFLSLVGTDGLLSLFIKKADGGNFNNRPINVTYTYQPDGYITDVGGRAVTNLIILLSALALSVTVMGFVFREQIKDLLGL